MILIFVASNDKSNIDWKSLTEAKKRELYTEFVLHYLPKELGDAAVGNPITFLIMIIVGAVIAKASAVIAACASLIGAGFSSLNIIEGCKMITKVAEGYDSISDVNAAKVSAKDCARGIALLGVEIIPVLFGLIKRGFAKYNGKKIKVGETSRSLNETSFANQSQVDAVYSEKSQQSLNSETIISKINNDELIRKYKNRLIDESSNIKKKGGLSDKKVQEILNVPKGSRPNTSEYLSKEYINIHIQKFDNGYSYLLTKNQYKMYVYKKEYLGIPSGASILIDMGLNFIPFVGQALDARDILACLDKIIRQKRTHEIMIWVTLVLTAIGCVPYAGDVIKAIGKAIVKGADDIIITLLKKLDAEDVYKAFIKFYNKINESTEEAIKIINQWLLEAEKRYNETDLSELIRNANEYINKAIEFIQTKIDEFAQKMFGKGNITLDVKLLEETSSNSKKTIKFVNGQITGEITNALKTEPGTAFFWSGCAKVDPSTGKLLVSGDEVAAEIASKSGGTTLETQIKINNIEMPKWDFDVPESIKAWEDTSAAYAKQVSGDVRAIVGKKLRPENIWENVELPRLMQNPNVSKITTIDPDTMAETVIFERKAGTVYGKPNETLVKNGEWDKIIDNLEKNGNKIDDEVKKANLLDKNGEFSDVKIESDYQKYIKRKKQKGETPRDRLDWKEQSDYWRNESPIARGNNYNKIVRNSNIYPYHEIHLENGKRLDSYDMLAGEIISRKATDLDKISEDTFRKYLSEFKEKYSKGTKIRSNTYPQLDGMELNGQYILEIPATNAMLSDIDYYKKIAEEYDVILRFTEEIKCLN